MKRPGLTLQVAMVVWAAVAAAVFALMSHELFPEWVGQLLPKPWNQMAIVMLPAFGASITRAAFFRNWNGSDARTAAPERPSRKKRG